MVKVMLFYKSAENQSNLIVPSEDLVSNTPFFIFASNYP